MPSFGAAGSARLATAAVALVTIGCGGSPDRPGFDEAACPPHLQELEYECGFVEAPERLGGEGDRTLRLKVAVGQSNGDRSSDAVLFLAGGPGGSGLEFPPPLLEDLREDRDVVLLDQRGTGLSRPSLDCPELDRLAFERLGRRSEDMKFIAAESLAVSRCRTRLVSQGIDLSAYSTAAIAADVERLRNALGYDKWNLVAVSYGTRVALAVIRNSPESVRSTVLDSPLPGEHGLAPEETFPNMARAFDALFDGCEADAACAEAYPDLRDRWIDLLREREAHPVVEEIRAPQGAESVDVYLDGELIGLVPYWFMFNEEAISVLPAVIDEMDRGHYEFVAETIVGIVAEELDGSDGMHFSVFCRDELAFTSARKVREGRSDRSPELPPGFPFESEFRACDRWDVPEAPANERGIVRSDVPALVLSGHLDPATPPAYGRDVSRTLASSYFYEFPPLGHGVLYSRLSCPQRIVQSFIDDPDSRPDATCLAEFGSPSWQ